MLSIISEYSFIQERKYQTAILQKLKEISNDLHKTPVIIELDCGLGKRILSYLIVQKYFPTKKVLVLLQATSSLSETYNFFKNKYKLEVGYIGSITPPSLRKIILKEQRVILSTPQTLANLYKNNSEIPFEFDLVLINEVDKIIRRTATRRTLIYPYPNLFELAHNNESWIIGLSGTIRDSHIIVTETVRLEKELHTLTENLMNVRIITMEEVMSSDPNFNEHIELTVLKSYGVEDPIIRNIFEKLDNLVKEYREKIISEAKKEGLIDDTTKNLALIAGQLPLDSEIKAKYNSLLMMRKYITGMMPVKFKQFLARFPEFSKEEIELISEKSKKIQSIVSLIDQTPKTIIMVSYVFTGEVVQKYLEKVGFSTFFVSGMTFDKGKVVEDFRSSNSNKSVLIMTQVGERDLDLPESKKIIVYDTVNTAKTMYQRFKRTRGGEVICMYYSGTSEENKIKRLYENIYKKYPWSIKIQ
ncbi:MAG: helicase-related protein [Candidatus Thorarchaeota archaeon]